MAVGHHFRWWWLRFLYPKEEEKGNRQWEIFFVFWWEKKKKSIIIIIIINRLLLQLLDTLNSSWASSQSVNVWWFDDNHYDFSSFFLCVLARLWILMHNSYPISTGIHYTIYILLLPDANESLLTRNVLVSSTGFFVSLPFVFRSNSFTNSSCTVSCPFLNAGLNVCKESSLAFLHNNQS